MRSPAAKRLLPVFATMAMAGSARATGHGPVYGLATPTLSEGSWSIDAGGMYRLMGDPSEANSHAAMFRPMIGYGITEDLQLSLSVPLPVYTHPGLRPSRMMGMMPATPDAEALLSWRFQRNANAVGSRFESTAIFGLDYPTDPRRDGVQMAPGFVAGAVTGYASRSIYAWAGALYRRYMTARGADHPGDLLLYSAVIGYRPEMFRRELPQSDWRIFVEAVGETTARDRIAGGAVADSGGTQILVGPTVLGLFGAWGISGGPLFPVYSRLNGTQQLDRVRLAVNYTYWF
jgi:hypothetical protein